MLPIRYPSNQPLYEKFPQTGELNPFQRVEALKTRAVDVGYNFKTGWDNPTVILNHLRTEIDEYEETIVNKESKKRQLDELGDVLYISTYAGLLQNLSPEKALNHAVDKFIARFHTMQKLITQEQGNTSLEAVTPEQWKQLWKAAKQYLALN